MDDFETKVSCQFAAFCKKVLRYTAIDCYNDYSRRRKWETSFSSLSQEDRVELYQVGEDFNMSRCFTVDAFQVEVQNELLADAIERLDEHSRKIILLYYFLGFKNSEIAELYGCTMRTVCRHKDIALKRMRKTVKRNL